MTFSIAFGKSSIKSEFDWQLCQEVNVCNEAGEVIAKAELELLTLNRHRDALESYELLSKDDEPCDWEILLNLFFKKHNLNAETCAKLGAKADPKKAQTHILVEAISVLPEYRKQGVSRLLLNAISETYPKAQSLSVLSMPMNLFVEAEHCETPENIAYYEALNLPNETIDAASLAAYFEHIGFIPLTVDEALLNVPLPYQMFMSTPSKLLVNVSE